MVSFLVARTGRRGVGRSRGSCAPCPPRAHTNVPHGARTHVAHGARAHTPGGARCWALTWAHVPHAARTHMWLMAFTHTRLGEQEAVPQQVADVEAARVEQELQP